jgi:glutathione S-transferase
MALRLGRFHLVLQIVNGVPLPDSSAKEAIVSTMTRRLRLVSHHLCPYVQRAVITLAEKGVAHERTYIDLANKPAWFGALSPLGKVPLLLVDETTAVFESSVICEYLEETMPGPKLHPEDPLERARHRAWIEFASATLGDIWGFETAVDAAAAEAKAGDLKAKLAHIERALGVGPYFAGSGFGLVDAAFAPVFRYFDVFDEIADFGIFADVPKVRNWRAALSVRPSVHAAAAPDYAARLRAFLKSRDAHLHRLAA